VLGLPTIFPIEVHWKSNEYCAYHDTQECQASFSWVKAVFFFKDNWKGFEPMYKIP
jgi:hypothetical protein